MQLALLYFGTPYRADVHFSKHTYALESAAEPQSLPKCLGIDSSEVVLM